eukprot:TRINITY_DN1414_c0_g2_i1.p1 TRINITY_DN1414_c0_g2~~TRINITY_DN1414_c0_g2_i1.p1  ORF type:complete len:754 (-),score=337.36 TRINITY_DN1414_c0_g2_i1:18-2279(-)
MSDEIDDVFGRSLRGGDEQEDDEAEFVGEVEGDESWAKGIIREKKKERRMFSTLPDGSENINRAFESHEIPFSMLVGDDERTDRMTAVGERQRLEVPLEKHIRKKQDRLAAFENVKERLQKWVPAVKRHRESEIIRFPDHIAKRRKVTTGGIAATMTPETKMEKLIAEAIESCGYHEADIMEREEEALAKMDPDTARSRLLEMRKLKDLLFRQEEKLRRWKRIKSRGFRKRFHKKDALKQTREEEEMDRAKERITLRHRNLSRRNRAGMSREEVSATDAEHRRLLAKMRGEEDDENGSDEDEIDFDAERKMIEDDEEGSDGDGDDDDGSGSGSLGASSRLMKLEFIKRGREKKKQEALRMLDELERQAKEEEESENDDSSISEEHNDGGQMAMPRRRRVLKTSTRTHIDENDGASGDSESDSESDSDSESESDDGKKAFKEKKIGETLGKGLSEKNEDGDAEMDQEIDEESNDDEMVFERENEGENVNPWLAVAVETKGKEKTKSKKMREKEYLKDEVVLDLSVGMGGSTQSKKKKDGKKIRRGGAGGDSDSDNGDEMEGRIDLLIGDGRDAEKEKVIREAFAGDDVMAAFAEEKNAEIDESVPQKEDTFLPGWGSWTGDGVFGEKKRLEKRRREANQRRKEEILAAKKGRKDSDLAHVIINEKRVKESAKYYSDAVPFPFLSGKQYESTISRPLGKDWNTETAFVARTRRELELKAGVAIQPMRTPKAIHTPRDVKTAKATGGFGAKKKSKK